MSPDKAQKSPTKTCRINTKPDTENPRPQTLLGGSWPVISGVISRVTIIITHIGGLITPLITPHEPPSNEGATRSQTPTGLVHEILKPKGLGFRVYPSDPSPLLEMSQMLLAGLLACSPRWGTYIPIPKLFKLYEDGAVYPRPTPK